MSDDVPLARSPYFLIKMRPARIPDDPQYGLTVTKKTLRHAVDRNRAKRLLRDWIRFNEKWMRDDRDYVFIARRAILDADRTKGRTAIKMALRFLKRLPDNATRAMCESDRNNNTANNNE